MKINRLAALLAFFLCAGAQAQLLVATKGDVDKVGSITSVNDVVVLPISGLRWATVKLSVTTAGTSTATTQVSIDGGVNYFGSAYAKRLDAVSANPTVQAISATTLATGNTWEIPLPANATHFRVLCAGSGTATTVDLIPWQLYAPGVPVIAVLSEATSAVNTSIGTGTVDLSGWDSMFLMFVISGGTASCTIAGVDDSGSTANLQWGPAITGTTLLGINKAGVAANLVNGAFLTKRMTFNCGAIVGQTSRIRMEVRR